MANLIINVLTILMGFLELRMMLNIGFILAKTKSPIYLCMHVFFLKILDQLYK